MMFSMVILGVSVISGAIGYAWAQFSLSLTATIAVATLSAIIIAFLIVGKEILYAVTSDAAEGVGARPPDGQRAERNMVLSFVDKREKINRKNYQPVPHTLLRGRNWIAVERVATRSSRSFLLDIFELLDAHPAHLERRLVIAHFATESRLILSLREVLNQNRPIEECVIQNVAFQTDLIPLGLRPSAKDLDVFLSWAEATYAEILLYLPHEELQSWMSTLHSMTKVQSAEQPTGARIPKSIRLSEDNSPL